MARECPERRARPHLGALQALLLAASAAGLAVACSADAQESTQLRGSVSEDEGYLLMGSQQMAADEVAIDPAPIEPPPAYVPVSPGALPDDSASLVDGTGRAGRRVER